MYLHRKEKVRNKEATIDIGALSHTYEKRPCPAVITHDP